MKNSNEFINESVYKTNLKYVRLQNKTEELFFKCLDEGRPLEYFEKELKKIWGNIDYKYFQRELDKYAEIIHIQNVEGRQINEEVEKDETGLFELTSLATIVLLQRKFTKAKEREYKRALNSPAYKNDKDEYLKLKVAKYDNQIVPYYSKATGKKIRDVQLSTYTAMIHNTNLTRTAWNTTLNDADRLGVGYFYIPPHPFSCPYCAEYQGKPISKRQIVTYFGLEAEEQEGDILHPNCKCTINFYPESGIIEKPIYGYGELEEQYNIRQKVNSLTLQKERIATDLKIQKALGNEAEADKLNSQRNAINKQIRSLAEALPTKALKKQVVAINR